MQSSSYVSEKNLEIRIVGLLGQTVIEKTEEGISDNLEKQIDVSALSEGIYLIVIRAGEKEFSEKIVVRH